MALLFVASSFLVSTGAFSGSTEGSSEASIAKPLGFEVTGGAAPGYVADKACATCHGDLWRSYQEVGMSRSFMRATPENLIENLTADPFHHQPSDRYYEMRRKGDRLIFRRYQLDDERRKVNLVEQEVDWIVGSGNKTRSYLYQTPSGELYQLPVGWYTETREWRMAPGFDSALHEGLQRQVQRECMFCHNAYPDVPAGSDSHWQPHRFPTTLPEGIGCQRCHGPGAEHIRSVIGGGDRAVVRSAIVNPARLPIEKRDSVCNQCHLLPAVAMIGVRRFDRADYSFRPGESLSDYMLHVEVDDGRRPAEERFEINHHGYRLRQSPCFLESEGKLTCISCHDPHRKVPEEKRVEHYGAVCLGCHEGHAVPEETSIEAADCTTCHMPQRRAQDVVHVVMTDHRIQLPPTGDPVEPIEESHPELEGLDFLMPDQAPDGIRGEIYKTVTAFRAIALPQLAARLERLVQETPELRDADFDLAMAQIKMKKNAEAEVTLTRLLQEHPEHPRVLQWLGIATMGLGELDRAEAYYRKGLEHDPDSAELHFNLGLLLLSRKQYAEARAELEQAVESRPHMAVGWFYLGQAFEQEGEPGQAIESHRRAIVSDPSYTRSYLALARVLDSADRREEAVTWLRRGARYAAQPEEIMAKLEEME